MRDRRGEEAEAGHGGEEEGWWTEERGRRGQADEVRQTRLDRGRERGGDTHERIRRVA